MRAADATTTRSIQRYKSVEKLYTARKTIAIFRRVEGKKIINTVTNLHEMTKTRAAPNVPICTPKTAKSSHPQTPLHRILSREKWQFSAVDFSISPSEQLRRGESNLIAWLLLAPGLMRNWPMVRAPIRHASPYVDHIWDQSLLAAIILIVFCCWNVYLLGKSERTPISPLLASQI